MKNIVLSLALVISATAVAQAQSIKYGVKAGASLTSLTGTNTGNRAYKVGFHGGVLANIGLSDMFSIQPEVLYSMKGSQAKGNSDDKFRLHYLDVPVLLKVATGKTGLFFELGPQVGFRLSATTDNGLASYTYTPYTKAVDFGYAAGLGFQAASGPIVGLRYNGGLTNVGKSGNINGLQVQASDAKNSAFQLYVGFLFGGK